MSHASFPLKEFFSNPPHIHLLQATIEIIDVWGLRGKLRYLCSSDKELEVMMCDTSSMQILIDVVECVDSNVPLSHETISNFIFMLVEGALISHRALVKALVDSLKRNKNAQVVSNILLDKLAPGRACVGPVIMVQLQKCERSRSRSDQH